jgi:hypothetical protein
MPPKTPSSSPSPSPSWLPRGYPDPNSIPQIALALSRGGSIDIPHPSSVIGLNLVQWGAAFSASTSSPARSLAELHEEMDGKPFNVQRSVKLGPFHLSAQGNIYGMTDYEIALTFQSQQVTAANGVTVEFSRSLAFRGESLGKGEFNRVVTFEYNYLDYTARSDVSGLPANSAQAGVYVKIAPLRLAAAAALVAAGIAAGIAAGYGLWQVLSTSPLGNPLPVP